MLKKVSAVYFILNIYKLLTKWKEIKIKIFSEQLKSIFSEVFLWYALFLLNFYKQKYYYIVKMLSYLANQVFPR